MKTAVIVLRMIKAVLQTAAAAAAIALIILFAVGNRFYIVRSGSMEPVISTGDLIIVNTRYDFERLTEGDIITYRAPNGALVTHRAITVSGDEVETKGDANNIPDGIRVDRENYLGKEWLTIPKLGFAAAAALSRKGRIILVTFIVSIIILSLFPENGRKQMKGEIKT